MIRVGQWATGNVGRAAMRAVTDHPELQLVGGKAYSGDKLGRDIGELAGIGPVGINAVETPGELLAASPDCVVYTPLLPDADEVCTLLDAGVDVVTPVGWWFPGEHQEHEPVRAAARRGGATLHGSGIHPGGITERFPLMVTALSSNVTAVRAEEFSDIRTYPAPDVVREIMMFGEPADAAEDSPMPDLLGAGFGQSIDMVAHALGWELDEDRPVEHHVGLATEDLDTPVGTIGAGTIAAQRFRWHGVIDGAVRITAAVNWFMGPEGFDTGWQLGDERFEVEITGDPPVELTFRGLHPASLEEGLEGNRGIIATANHCVNAIPHVVDAAPGIATYLDLPLITGRGVTPRDTPDGGLA